jgi:hypothetical protein
MARTVVGIAGHPPWDVLSPLWEDPEVEILDLDVPDAGVPLHKADPYLPRIYCAVLRTVVANAAAKRPDRILADVGEGKCDGMRLAAEILADAGHRVETTRNTCLRGDGTPVCRSGLPLREKFDRITERLATGRRAAPPAEAARAGFWGVPPHDMSILDLFPHNTHVFGWTRCLENGTPADLDLEMTVDKGLPTVFFAQSFCQKNALARYLAGRYNGLYLEVNDSISRPDRAKIEAFFEFNLG